MRYKGPWIFRPKPLRLKMAGYMIACGCLAREMPVSLKALRNKFKHSPVMEIICSGSLGRGLGGTGMLGGTRFELREVVFGRLFQFSK